MAAEEDGSVILLPPPKPERWLPVEKGTKMPPFRFGKNTALEILKTAIDDGNEARIRQSTMGMKPVYGNG